VEKGNGEAGELPAAESDTSTGGGSSAGPGSETGTQPVPPDGGADGGAGGGGAQADQSGPDDEQPDGGAGSTRVRDPWAGTPDVGETTLPDGTRLRRDANGNMYRGPDAEGNEHVWDAQSGEWLRDADRTTHPASEGWRDPATDWHEAWGGQQMPPEWRDVPRSGGTQLPEGTLNRDAAGNYRLDTPDGGSYRWNEQSGQWYDAQSGRAAPPGVGGDPVDGWLRGAQIDAQMRADPTQPHPFRGQGQVRP